MQLDEKSDIERLDEYVDDYKESFLTIELF